MSPAAVVLALPVHAPCTEAEHLVRITGGAEARSAGIVTAAPCADAPCETRLPSRETPGRLRCDSAVCRWIVTTLPSPLEVVADANWDVTGFCPTGSVGWNARGFSYAIWTVAEPVPDLPKLASFAAIPTGADAQRAVDEIGARVRTLLGYCDRIGCTAAVRATGVRLQRALTARGQPALGPPVTWARSESGRPEGWTARYIAGDTVLELATTRVSEGGSGWGLRATSGSNVWLEAGISADGPTSTNLTIGTAHISQQNGDSGPEVVASGPAIDLR